MRNKGTVVVLAVIITLLSIYQLYFSFRANSIDEEITIHATEQAEAAKVKNPALTDPQFDSIRSISKVLYEDSIRDIDMAFDGSTYNEIKRKELNLGLDLQGGMHITLVVSPEEIMKALAGKKQFDAEFMAAMDAAKEAQTSSQEKFTDLFYQAFLEQNGGKKDQLYTLFLNKANSGSINIESTDEDILQLINRELDGAIDRSIIVLRSRIDKFGATQPIIQPVKSTGRIEIELPGVDDKERIKNNIQAVAKLEFLEEAPVDQQAKLFGLLRNKFVEIERERIGQEGAASALDLPDNTNGTEQTALFVDDEEEDSTSVEEDSTELALSGDPEKEDTVAAISNDQEVQELVNNYLSAQQVGNRLYFRSNKSYQNRIDAYLSLPEVRALFPDDVTFMWGVEEKSIDNPDERKFVPVYFIKKGLRTEPLLTGDVVDDARYFQDPTNGKNGVTMKFDPEGTAKWAKISTDFYKSEKPVAIVLDNVVYSLPYFQQPITGGNSQVTGSYTVQEAQDLANILKAGRLPAPLTIEQMIEVGPTLGEAAVNRGLLSLVAGLVLVVLFMILYYSKGGLIADIALLFNIFFILGILSTPSIGAALTLPGMAGIVLTIGMSIDANVLIFERIREELKLGKAVNIAIKNGYDKAFWTIFDANVTTLLTAIILYAMGTGLVRGFAVTLMIGIACSFFSAVFITRLIVEFMTRKKKETSKLTFETALSKKLFQKHNVNFIGKRKLAYLFSLVVIVTGIVLMSTKGLNLGVALTGGRSYIVKFDEAIESSQVRSNLKKAFGDQETSVEVKSFDTPKQVNIVTDFNPEVEAGVDQDSLVSARLMAALDQNYKDLNPEQQQSIVVGPTIADDIKNSSIKSIIVALVVIFLYIIIRFRKWQFGTGALVALFHDVFFVLSTFAIAKAIGLSFEVDEVFFAAVLTIVGYSINDTVVVFDRVREFMNDNPKAELKDTLNKSLNSTISRTLMTSITTLIVVVVLLIWGGEALRGFSFALLIGVLAGTYSSVFVATPIVLDATTTGEKMNKKKEEKEEAQPEKVTV